jgi:2-polyprenyl-6-methoxyphenol hydroxylase-like FAD-dependent oxidoreductase
MHTEVLIAGAGPTGLAMALWLARLGIPFRIVDKTPEPARESRALVVHARTLELYAQVGFAEEALKHGIKFEALNLWVSGRRAAHVEIGNLGADVSPYPYMLILAQDQHERLLVERLASLGVQVERSTELTGFEERGDGIVATLRRADGHEERCECAWLAGCDGARSIVRETLRLGFPGGTYKHLFYVADVQAKGPVVNGELNVALDSADLLAVFPLPGEGNVRFVGTIGAEAEAQAATRELTWNDVSRVILERLRMDVARVNWFSTYHVHHRVTDRFRVGRAFVLGDAAHIHSPVGGQGMNTGIGDAVNLAWKLAMVVRGRADERILDTYETERMAFARRLVATTDRAFTFASSAGPLARFVRLYVLPHTMPAAMRLHAVRRFFFGTVSQTLIEYRQSALSTGTTGRTSAGDRLPWTGDNFAPLCALDWQAHVYGTASRELIDVCRKLSLALHVFPWTARTAQAGLAHDALYLVRPDGYIGFADPGADPARLEAYLTRQFRLLSAGEVLHSAHV